MARVLFTAVVAEMRGKLNGNVFTRNKGGAVLRNKVTPINPNTSHQSLQRSYTSDIAKAWANTITDNQRKAWTSYGQDAGATNIFGNGLILSGIAAYQKVNRIILNSGGTRIDDPPTDRSVDSILSLVLTANSAGPVLSLVFTPTPFAAGVGLYIFATPALSPGIANVSTQLRFIGYFDAATSPLNIATEWTARFGALPGTAGQRIGLTAQVVNTATGAISAAAGTSTLVI